jgi:Fe-S oxidoreductase
VQQCPVDIEHVDHIVDMRRYQVLVESNFPAELNQLFKGLENKGNPWNMSANARLEWAKDLPFDVKVVGEDIESLDEVDWLFWVGCAGAYEDRAKKTTRAVAELLDMAGVSFGVLGNGETCTGDPARRAGNEFVFQGLAAQNAETFKEMKVKKVVSTCAHCFNTLKNEYSQFGVELEVVHHTQLLNRLVREGRLTPVAAANGTPKRSLTYHDPCYLGRHNQVYSPPRELLDIIPDAELKEMPRNSERSFCCGAGGARMWMEEKIGERINLNRTNEAVETGADQIATGCPFCRVMLSDGLTAKQADGSAREEVEVLDVAQLLLASVKGESRTPAAVGASATAGGANAVGAAAGGRTAVMDREATQAEPAAGDVTQSANTVTDTEDVGVNAAAAEEKDPEVETSKPVNSGSLFDPAPEAADNDDKPSGGVSLFDTPADTGDADRAPAEPSAGGGARAMGPGGSLFDTPADRAPSATETSAAEPTSDVPSSATATGGSLFDTPAHTPATTDSPVEEETAAAEPIRAAEASTPTPHAGADAGLGAGGSLFDIAPTEPEPATTTAQSAPPTEQVTPNVSSGTDAEAAAEAPADAAATGKPGQAEREASATAARAVSTGLDSAESLFDIAPSEPEPAASAATVPNAPQANGTAREDEPAEEPQGEASTDAQGEASAEPQAEAKEPRKPAGGIDEDKSLFDF